MAVEAKTDVSEMKDENVPMIPAIYLFRKPTVPGAKESTTYESYLFVTSKDSFCSKSQSFLELKNIYNFKVLSWDVTKDGSSMCLYFCFCF